MTSMFSSRGVKVFVFQGAADMRKSFEGLSGLVRLELGENPLSGAWFVFFNRRRDYVKVLYWEESGYCIWSKRLEAGTFQLKKEMKELQAWELMLVLEGVELREVKQQERFRLAA